MTNSVAIIMNSQTLGGAERSMLIQSRYFGKVDIIVPPGELSKYCRSYGSVRHFSFPKFIVAVSRTGKSCRWFLGILGLPLLFFQFKKLNISKYRVIWANGNKVGFSLFLYLLLTRFKGKLVWHFRDYPIVAGKLRYLWKLLNFPHRFELFLVGNSNSVAESLKRLGRHPVKTIYNPVGFFPEMKKSGEVRNIGVVSMMAPWKGLHQIIVWASLYEKELVSMGIEKITFFGGQIYQTAGAHNRYQNELELLLKKFPSVLISFGGRADPVDIYQQIDLLVHPVVGPEPFGRVITEAYSCGIPVLSTCLGGSDEIVVDGEFFVYDYAGLTEKVRILAKERGVYNDLVERGQKRVKEVEQNIGKAIIELLGQDR